MTDNTARPETFSPPTFGANSPHGPTRLTNYALLRNLVGQTITDDLLRDTVTRYKITSVKDGDGTDWAWSGKGGFVSIDIESGLGPAICLENIVKNRGPVTITGIVGVPNEEAEEEMALARQRAEFELAREKCGSSLAREFVSDVQLLKNDWNKMWPVGSRVHLPVGGGEYKWFHTVSAAYWYADALCVDLCNGRHHVIVENLDMADSAGVQAGKWNRAHGSYAYEFAYIDHSTRESIKTTAKSLAFALGGKAVVVDAAGLLINLDDIVSSETEADRMSKIKDALKQDRRVTVIPAGDEFMPYLHSMFGPTGKTRADGPGYFGYQSVAEDIPEKNPPFDAMDLGRNRRISFGSKDAANSEPKPETLNPETPITE